MTNSIALEIVELYPYVEVHEVSAAGCIALAMYISVMIGGGMLYIDDKARGVHEGYLVTPITGLELVLGLNLAGSIKAVLSGISSHRHRLADGRPGHYLSSRADAARCLPDPGHVVRLQRHDVSADGARGRSAGAARHVRRSQHAAVLSLGRHVSRAAFPKWLRAIAVSIRLPMRFTDSRPIILKDGGFVAIQFDLLFLIVFGIGTLLIATPLFKRTL